jgi:hypothetical protein
MPPRIVPILERLRQDQSALLQPHAIEAACRQEGYTWRKRLLDPVVTIYLFLLQILHGNTACSHIVQFGCWTFSDSAYCQARKRLPLRVFHRLLEWLTEAGRRTTASAHRWFGHRVWVLDGSSFSMPDTPELQAAFGQPGNQEPGCGFPVAKWLALFDVGTGMLLRCATAPLRSHEMSRCAAISEDAEPGDIVMGDRGLSSYAHLAILAVRGLHGLFRLHQRRAVDAGPVRLRAGGSSTARRACRARGGRRCAANRIRSSSGTSPRLSSPPGSSPPAHSSSKRSAIASPTAAASRSLACAWTLSRHPAAGGRFDQVRVSGQDRFNSRRFPGLFRHFHPCHETRIPVCHPPGRAIRVSWQATARTGSFRGSAIFLPRRLNRNPG